MTIRIDRLQALREQRGLSQRELARLCGIGETQIRKYESGMVDPSATNLGLIAEALEVSTDYLLGRTDSPQVHMSESELDQDETLMVGLYRREGWQGLARVSVENCLSASRTADVAGHVPTARRIACRDTACRVRS